MLGLARSGLTVTEGPRRRLQTWLSLATAGRGPATKADCYLQAPLDAACCAGSTAIAIAVSVGAYCADPRWRHGYRSTSATKRVARRAVTGDADAEVWPAYLQFGNHLSSPDAGWRNRRLPPSVLLRLCSGFCDSRRSGTLPPLHSSPWLEVNLVPAAL